LVTPRFAATLTIARFLGPGFNQFQNWNTRGEESDEDTSDGEDLKETKKPQQDDDEEGWTAWKNGDDIKNRFNRKKKPGRIIHLGDGSELFTDRAGGDEHDEHMSTSSDDESEDEPDKKQVDGVHSESATKPTSAENRINSEARAKSPQATPEPASQSPRGK
jgi:hypothetical protein